MGGEERGENTGGRALFMVFITFRSDLHRILSTTDLLAVALIFLPPFSFSLFFAISHFYDTRSWVEIGRVRRCDDFIKRMNGFLFHVL
jgi:hypothetical protein